MGSTEGIEVGNAVGSGEGLTVGNALGSNDGCSVGSAVGCNEGGALGNRVGNGEGDWVGCMVGAVMKYEVVGVVMREAVSNKKEGRWNRKGVGEWEECGGD